MKIYLIYKSKSLESDKHKNLLSISKYNIKKIIIEIRSKQRFVSIIEFKTIQKQLSSFIRYQSSSIYIIVQLEAMYPLPFKIRITALSLEAAEAD